MWIKKVVWNRTILENQIVLDSWGMKQSCGAKQPVVKHIGHWCCARFSGGGQGGEQGAQGGAGDGYGAGEAKLRPSGPGQLVDAPAVLGRGRET